MERLLRNCEVASRSNFRDNRDKIYPDAEVGGGADGINAICSRPELASYVVSIYNVETFHDYHATKIGPYRRSSSFYSGNCHRIWVERAGVLAGTLLNPDK